MQFTKARWVVDDVLPSETPVRPMRLIDALARYARKHPPRPDSGLRPERRQRRRTPVRWRVLIWTERGSPPVETVTRDLSSSGFYCMSPKPLTPGEIVRCVIRLPASDPRDTHRPIGLECEAQVVRAEAAVDGSFGIACRIENYRLGDGLRNAEASLPDRRGEVKLEPELG